ncbi:hypothetical protein ES703_79775 [subsurface metagenome]
MKKSLMIGIVLVSILLSVLLVMPLASAGEMTTEITGECTYYDRGIEYERCCPMGDKINCVSCRDTDGGRDYYTKGETREMHWNRFERGALVSVPFSASEECLGNIDYREYKNQLIRKELQDRWKYIEEVERENSTYVKYERDGVTKEVEYENKDKVNVLRETYCEWVGEYKKKTYELYECPNGCEDGACIRDDGCPTAIGWRIEGIKCFVDTGCYYDSSTYDYYDSAEECIKKLGKVEYPVLEPLPVPNICSELLIEKDIKGYNYREIKYSRMGPDVYSEDGRQIGASQCCVAYYKKNILDIIGSIVYVCPLDSRQDAENSIKWGKEDYYELGEYNSQTVYWMRKNGNEALVWTNNNNILAVADEGGKIPDDIAKAYLKKHNSDLGDVDVEITEVTPEAEETIEEPRDIPEEKMFYSCTGCELGGKCYPIGYRKEGRYCSDNNEFIDQSKAGTCDNSFECKSNVCISGECIEEGLIKRIIGWFRKLFGGE